MSEDKALSSVSESCSDNLERVQEVFGKIPINHLSHQARNWDFKACVAVERL